MLNDFFMIEIYFGTPESAMLQDDMIRRYGTEPVKRAVERGYLCSREIFCGPLRGKVLHWLSEEGRREISV